MTEAKVRALVKHWSKRLGVDHWQIVVRFDAPAGKLDEDDAAATECTDEYDIATLWFQPWVSNGPYPEDRPGPEWDDRQVEVTVVHELLHLVLRDIKTMALLPMEEVLGKEVYSVFKIGVEASHEQVIERTAQALVAAWYK